MYKTKTIRASCARGLVHLSQDDVFTQDMNHSRRRIALALETHLLFSYCHSLSSPIVTPSTLTIDTSHLIFDHKLQGETKPIQARRKHLNILHHSPPHHHLHKPPQLLWFILSIRPSRLSKTFVHGWQPALPPAHAFPFTPSPIPLTSCSHLPPFR